VIIHSIKSASSCAEEAKRKQFPRCRRLKTGKKDHLYSILKGSTFVQYYRKLKLIDFKLYLFDKNKYVIKFLAA